MELINRDDLYKKLVYFDYEFNKTNSPLGNPTEEQKLLVSGIVSQIRDHILKNMPAVEAVPIEWIENRLGRLCTQFAEETRSSIKEQYVPVIAAISDLLDDWEEENIVRGTDYV